VQVVLVTWKCSHICGFWNQVNSWLFDWLLVVDYTGCSCRVLAQ